MSTTYAENRFITGSAAAGTALATGHKTTIGTISMDAAKEKPLKTIAEQAKEEGFKIGIISSVSIDHATPACFYAHQSERGMYHEIALDLPASGFNFFGGGGFKDPFGGEKETSVYTLLKEQGYILSWTKQSFDDLKKGDEKVVATGSILEPSGAIRYSIDQTDDDIPLEDFVAKGIELLENEDGFFIMCEEGKIDWAAHENDGRTVIDNVISLSKSVEVAMEFYQNHPEETLIIVTADHETGGLSMGHASSKYDTEYAYLAAQEVSSQSFTLIADSLFADARNQNLEFALQLVEDYFGLGRNAAVQLTDYEQGLLEQAYYVFSGKKNMNNEEANVKYGGYHPLAVTATRILNNKAGLAFTTWSHTGIPVPVFAIGAGAEHFDGYYDNTDIPKKIAKAMGLNFEVDHSKLN
jgi:alkaline phosphatase